MRGILRHKYVFESFLVHFTVDHQDKGGTIQYKIDYRFNHKPFGFYIESCIHMDKILDFREKEYLTNANPTIFFFLTFVYITTSSYKVESKNFLDPVLAKLVLV